MNMKEIPDSEYTIECDLILIAAGFLGTQKYVADAFGVKLNARTNVETAPGEHKTNVEQGVHMWRYAPWTVAGCMGDPRGT